MGPDDPDYLIRHSARSAEVVNDWLNGRSEGRDEAFCDDVRRLILRHEFGGSADEDVLQAADSLAFLSTFDWLVVEWVQNGLSTRAQAQQKLDWMLCRIRMSKAVALGLPYYRAASRALANPAQFPTDLKRRRSDAGDLALLLGRKAEEGQMVDKTE